MAKAMHRGLHLLLILLHIDDVAVWPSIPRSRNLGSGKDRQHQRTPMKATALDFRFRYLLQLVIYAIGFTAPWNLFLHYDTIRTWQLLAATLARAGWLGFSAATLSVLGAGIALAFVAAAVRTWAAAYLGDAVAHDGRLVGDSVVAGGPYRYLRHPL